MLERNQRKEMLKALYTMKQDLEGLLTSLSKKDDELSKLENNGICEECQLTPDERRLRIESLAYDIITGNGTAFLSSIQQLTEDYFDRPIPKEIRV